MNNNSNMTYCCECEYYDKEKEYSEEKKNFYADNKYDITYETFGWCSKYNHKTIPDYPIEYCEAIHQERGNYYGKRH